jgi:GAF domain
VNEAKTAKSFRAAADRILLQQTSTDAGITRLLSSRAPSERAIETEDDAWAIRLTSLCALALWDAVVLVGESPTRIVRSHNLDARTLDSDLAAPIADASQTESSVQTPARVTLADGRLAESALVAPLRGIRGVTGSVIAFRVGRGFGAMDAQVVANAAQLCALDVHLAASLRRESLATHQAIALYEISRLCLFGGDAADVIHAVVELLVRSLDHDVAQLWVLRPGGSLRLSAAQPREGLELEIARPRDHIALSRALAGEVTRVHDPSLRSWMPRTTRDLIVAPLVAGDVVSGVLVLGRWRSGYDADDEAMARTCAQFIGQSLMRQAPRGQPIEASESEEEAQLTGS